MFSYRDITAEDRAIIVLSLNFKLSEETDDKEKLYPILFQMFAGSPKLSYYEIPIVYSILEDFYRVICDPEWNHQLRFKDRNVLNELQDNCKALIDKIRDACDKNDISLALPS